MVAAQWGETRDSDARTSGGVSGRFRLLGASSGEAPDTTPPPFGTAPWGYRRSEVDAWASWVAGLVAHGRNETVRADSAEATLRATLERLEQVERTPTGPPGADGVRPLSRRAGRDKTDGCDPDDDAGTAPPSATPTAPATPPAAVGSDVESMPDGEAPVADEPPDDPAPTGPGPVGRLRCDPPADLPRRDARGGSAPKTSPQDAGAHGTGSPTTPAQPDPAPPDPAPRDPDLARLHVVETTLHEVLGLLHHLADRERRPAGS